MTKSSEKLPEISDHPSGARPSPTARPTFLSLDAGKRRRITDEALDEFAAHGYGRASLNRLVQRLGIAKGSIFQYFGSKEGLFAHVFEAAAGSFADRLRAIRSETADQDFYARLAAVLQAGVEFVRAHPRIYRIYLKVQVEDLPLRERLLGLTRQAVARYLRPMVQEAQARGEVDPALDPDLVVFSLDALLDRFLQAYAVPGMDAGAGLLQADPATVSARIDQLVAMLRQGLNPQGAPQGASR